MYSRPNTVTCENNIKEKFIKYKENVLEEFKELETTFFGKVNSFKK